MDAIVAQGASKTYKNGVQALNGLNLSVKQGEIFSLLGENGAGKTTLIRILTTYLKPDAGQILVLGREPGRDGRAIRSRIACVSQQPSFDTYLSLEENMMFQGRLYKIPRDKAKKRMEKLIADFELKPYRKYPAASYSGGVKRRLDIAMNMMSEPKILFLDEPTVGLDIRSRMMMWDMMRKIRDESGTTIFLTTHYLEEAERLSDTVCIMKEGKELLQGTPSELRSLTGEDILKTRLRSPGEARQRLRSMGERYPETEAFTQPTLEDVFLRLTEEKGQEGGE